MFCVGAIDTWAARVLQVDGELLLLFGWFRDDRSCVGGSSGRHVLGVNEVAVVVVVMMMVATGGTQEGSRQTGTWWCPAERRVLQVHQECTLIDDASACVRKTKTEYEYQNELRVVNFLLSGLVMYICTSAWCLFVHKVCLCVKVKTISISANISDHFTAKVNKPIRCAAQNHKVYAGWTKHFANRGC